MGKAFTRDKAAVSTPPADESPAASVAAPPDPVLWRVSCTIPTIQSFRMPVLLIRAETVEVARERYRVKTSLHRDDAVITAERIM